MPITSPVRVRPAESTARAMPKSVSFATPVGVTMMLAGLTSRCTTPAEWAAPRARAACVIRSATSSGGSAPRSRIICATVRPGTYSITSQAPSSFSPKSWTAAMLWWCSWAEWRASERNRSSKPSVSLSPLVSSFTATGRCSTSSSACQTSPMPPVAMCSVRR